MEKDIAARERSKYERTLFHDEPVKSYKAPRFDIPFENVQVGWTVYAADWNIWQVKGVEGIFVRTDTAFSIDPNPVCRHPLVRISDSVWAIALDDPDKEEWHTEKKLYPPFVKLMELV